MSDEVKVGQSGWFQLPGADTMIEGEVVEVSRSGFTIKGRPLDSTEPERLYHFPVT